ncbi:hypothetical protein O6H91_08G109500 [Diphasiastrum complanatum]|uniref:Uncharacterized protein n=1 Tax=Diphasiastrum complanatum TaxID=34168 RepID=A0ACC2D0S3_DIPCM|nr:hypothetical protein O6H91_08G109500 [Diphasiastrum complanatum]
MGWPLWSMSPTFIAIIAAKPPITMAIIVAKPPKKSPLSLTTSQCGSSIAEMLCCFAFMFAKERRGEDNSPCLWTSIR